MSRVQTLQSKFGVFTYALSVLSFATSGVAAPADADEVEALRAEVKALREELKQVVAERQANPPEPVPEPVPKAEPEPANLAPTPVTESAPSPVVPEPAQQPSESETAPSVSGAAPTTLPGSGSDLLPIELTAFGDFYYRVARGEGHGFGIGTVELDPSLRLTPYVLVSTAIGYSPDSKAFELPAFVIDCGLFGQGSEFVFASDAVVKSGVSFGKFDVPFGTAYLEYPSVVNRLITLPQAVLLTHGAWNDLGLQAYAVGEYWSALAFLVNGPELAADAEATEPASSAVGGRLAGKLDGVIEVGGSFAGVFPESGASGVLAGGDIAATLGRFDLRAEYLLKHRRVPGIPDNTHGIYARAAVDLKPVFVLARFDTVIERAELVDRRITFGATLEVFNQGEVRAVYEESFDQRVRTFTVQLAGGSTFQPTGLRR